MYQQLLPLHLKIYHKERCQSIKDQLGIALTVIGSE